MTRVGNLQKWGSRPTELIDFQLIALHFLIITIITMITNIVFYVNLKCLAYLFFNELYIRKYFIISSPINE